MTVLWMITAFAVVGLAPPVRDGDVKKADLKTYSIPYRLTNTNHFLVRAKINGKGPFNFIVDTGAPALFVATAVCKKLGIEPDGKGWGTFDRFEVEGGAVVEKARARIEDPFQLKGMNGLGLAGVELHGMIGYTVLARFKVEIDLTRDKMSWTALAFDPPTPKGLEGGQAGVDTLGALVEFALAFLGNRPKPEVAPRGFLGLELENGEGVVVKSVLAKGPAAKAGLKPGDRITRVHGEAIESAADLRKQAAKLVAGESAIVTIVRGRETKEITLTAGEGL